MRLIAGRLSQFIPQWKKITSDSFVLNCVKKFEVPFLERPPWALSFNKDLRFSSEDERSLKNEIKKLIAVGGIVRCEPVEDQFLSPFFLVPKLHGSKRFILNLKCLNQFIKTSHFKIEDMRVALKLIYQNYFLCNLDFKDAYFLVKVGPHSRKFLRFKFKDQILEFQCLPFGLCTSPYVFTKLLKPVLNFLRERGWLSTAYLDDTLYIGKSLSECRNNVAATKKIFKELEFIINEEKSKLELDYECQYLSFIINSKDIPLSLPGKKKCKLIKKFKNF